MLNTPFPPWPSFTDEEIAAVTRVLASNRVNYWTGTEGREFENEFARWIGVPHAIALNNGTVALEVALHALGIGPGDEVVVTPRSFIASASCVVSAGARPVFADVDRDTQNITARTIEAVLTSRTRAVIPVHLAGMPCDMDDIMALARARKLAVIEDCAQAAGASYKGRPVGSIGDIGAWSFCQDKILTTGGEGGMVTTSDPGLWQTMWSYKDHGKSWPAVYERQHGEGFRWLHESFGTNGRMLEMQAAIGRAQLRHIDATLASRRSHARRIWAAAAGLPGLRVPPIPEWANHAAYRAYVFIEPGALARGWDRDRVVAEIKAHGVPCYSGSCSEIYLEKAFAGTGYAPAEPLPVARELGETSVMFLVHPTLEDRHIDLTCDALRKVMGAAVRQTVVDRV
jgi:dTDP-4-amino-4,6-dideoxygalactose transaminase